MTDDPSGKQGPGITVKIADSDPAAKPSPSAPGADKPGPRAELTVKGVPASQPATVGVATKLARAVAQAQGQGQPQGTSPQVQIQGGQPAPAVASAKPAGAAAAGVAAAEPGAAAGQAEAAASRISGTTVRHLKQEPKPVEAAPEPPRLDISPGDVTWDPPLLVCLSTLCGLLQRPMSTSALIAGLPIDKAGFTPALFVRAAERAGLVSRLVKRGLDQLSPLNLPCVLVLKGQNALILTRIRSDAEVEVISPEGEKAKTVVKTADLEKEYSGYVLFAKVEGMADIVADEFSDLPRGSWFWRTIRRLWPVYGHVILASLVVNLFAIATPIFAMNVYDRVVPNQAVETLWVLAIGVGVVFGFDFILRTLRGYFVDSAGKSADIVMARHLFAHVLGMQYDKRPASTGAFASNLRDYEQVRDFITSATLVALIDMPFALLFILGVFIIAGPLAIVPLGGAAIIIISGVIIQAPLKRLVQKTQHEAAQKHAVLVESIEGLDTLKVSGAEGRAQSIWERVVAQSARTATSVRLFSTIAINISLVTANLVYVVVIVIGVYEIKEGNLTMGGLIAASILSGRAMAPMAQVAGLLARLHQSMSSLRALTRLMNMPTERPVERRFISRTNIRGQLEFKGVSFSYPEQKISALEKISFYVDAGEKVGIIGRIGSGKSTISRLITGLYQPSEGAILLDGTDIRQLDPAEMRRRMGCVQQDPFLFSGTVRENISIGAPHIDDSVILRAATLAGVDDFLKRHPMGYDLPVGEHGRQISGGQRQSIAIARALLLDPPVLVLDEPTSSMDNASEARFRARLAQIVTNKTLILITHRSSMLQLVDRLIVLDGGRVVADGPKAQVLNSLMQGEIRVAKEG
ncbi:MAG: type I secretion system permease/ATPase [Alphaproteobacteria bacterium]